MRNIAGLAGDKIALERVVHIAYMSCLGKKASEVRARDQPIAGDVFARAIERIRNACFAQ